MSPAFTRNTRKMLVVWIAYGAVLAAAPHVLEGNLALNVLSQIGYLIIACLSYNILLGQGGMLSFGHAIYTGAGAYTGILLLSAMNKQLLHVPVTTVPILAGLGAMAVALPLGWVTTKKSATAFAMITFGLGELVLQLAQMLPRYFGGEGGVSADRVTGSVLGGVTFGPQIQLYYLIALYAFVCTGAIYAFTLTPLGRALRAGKDNPERIEFFGFDSHRVRFYSFVISAFFAGVSGGLAALNFEIVTTESLSSVRSGTLLLFTFVGGTGWFFGPIVGAVLMVVATVVLSEITQAWLLYLGLFFVLSVMYMPGGLAGLAAEFNRLLRNGLPRGAIGTVLVLCGAVSLAIVSLCAVVELIYRHFGENVSGERLVLLGHDLNGASASTWLVLVLGAATGLALAMKALGNLRGSSQSDSVVTEAA